MPGSPQKRAINEREAIKRTEILAQKHALENALQLPKKRVNYSTQVAAEVIALTANGVPIDDSVLNGAVIAPGVATRLGINPSTFYLWQQTHPDFAEGIAAARTESAHRLADKMLSLADIALHEPAMANAVRVAADILKWSASVRNRQSYGDQQRVELSIGMDLGEKLRRAKERVIDDNSPTLLSGD